MAPVSTGAAVAVLRHWFVAVANRRVASGPPPSGWRLKKLPGASQGFYFFLSLSCFVIPSFLLWLPVFLLCLCAVLGTPGHQTLWFKLLVAMKTHTILESSASTLLADVESSIRQDSDKKWWKSSVVSYCLFSGFCLPAVWHSNADLSLCFILIYEPCSHSVIEDYHCSSFPEIFLMYTLSLGSGVIFPLMFSFPDWFLCLQ